MTLQESLTQEEGRAPLHLGVAEGAPLPSPCSLDEALMKRVASGDAAAFGKLVNRYSARLYRLAYRLLCDAHEAEEAVQDSFTRLWQGAPNWRSRGGGVAGWLHRVTINTCLDRLRKFRIVADDACLNEVEDLSPGPERRAEMRGLESAIELALAALPHRHRAALVLCYLEGVSNALAAEMLGLHLKAMESLLFRARRSLREQLELSGVAIEDLDLLR